MGDVIYKENGVYFPHILLQDNRGRSVGWAQFK